MYSTARLFALLGIVVLSGCAGGAFTSSSTPLLPQSVRQSPIAAPAQSVVFISVPSVNAIESFPGGVANPKPAVAIKTGINNPAGIAVGGSGTLFVNNTGNNTVTEYAPGATKPNFTLKLSAGIGDAIAAGPDDSLYVTDQNGNIDVYPLHATQPSAILPNPGNGGPGYGLGAIAVDKSDDVFVVGHGGECCGTGVFEYPAASPNSSFVAGTGAMGGGVASDAAGDLFTSPGGTLRKNFVHVLHPGGTSTNFKAPPIALMTFDAAHQYLYSTFGTVTIYDYATRKIVGTISHIFDAYGIAVRPAAF